MLKEEVVVQVLPANRGRGNAFQKPMFAWKDTSIHPEIHQFTAMSDIKS